MIFFEINSTRFCNPFFKSFYKKSGSHSKMDFYNDKINVIYIVNNKINRKMG